MKRRIQRAVIDKKDVLGGALDVFRDSVAVERPEQQRPQDQEVEYLP